MRTSSRGQGLTGPTPPALGHMEALPFAFGHRVSEYHLFTEGIDRSTPVGVVVRLHVDGAEEFRHPDGLLTSLARVTAERNMILAALLTPHRTRGCTWWRKLEKNIAWLDVVRSCWHPSSTPTVSRSSPPLTPRSHASRVPAPRPGPSSTHASRKPRNHGRAVAGSPRPADPPAAAASGRPRCR